MDILGHEVLLNLIVRWILGPYPIIYIVSYSQRYMMLSFPRSFMNQVSKSCNPFQIIYYHVNFKGTKLVWKVYARKLESRRFHSTRTNYTSIYVDNTLHYARTPLQRQEGSQSHSNTCMCNMVTYIYIDDQEFYTLMHIIAFVPTSQEQLGNSTLHQPETMHLHSQHI